MISFYISLYLVTVLINVPCVLEDLSARQRILWAMCYFTLNYSRVTVCPRLPQSCGGLGMDPSGTPYSSTAGGAITQFLWQFVISSLQILWWRTSFDETKISSVELATIGDNRWQCGGEKRKNKGPLQSLFKNLVWWKKRFLWREVLFLRTTVSY